MIGTCVWFDIETTPRLCELKSTVIEGLHHFEITPSIIVRNIPAYCYNLEDYKAQQQSYFNRLRNAVGHDLWSNLRVKGPFAVFVEKCH